MRSAGDCTLWIKMKFIRGTWNIQVISTMLPVTSIWPRIMLCRKSSASIRGRYLTKNGSRRKNAGIAAIHNRWLLRFKSVCQKLTAHRACNMPPNTAVSFLICFWKLLYYGKDFDYWEKRKQANNDCTEEEHFWQDENHHRANLRRGRSAGAVCRICCREDSAADESVMWMK